MFFLNTPVLIVAIFLLFNLLAGIYISFNKKVTSLREYAVGSKKFPTATLVTTVLATAYSGGGLVRNVEQVHQLGLYWVIVLILGDLGLWGISSLGLRMQSFMHNLSMADTIGNVYGKLPRIIVALFSVGSSITMVAMQIHVIALSISFCIPTIDNQIITVLSTLILIFYSAFGGVRAITITDIFQFFTFSIILPLLACFMFDTLGKPAEYIIPFLQQQKKFQFASLFDSNINFMGMLALISSIFVSYIDPTILQKVYMCSNAIQARKIFRYGAFFGIFINIVSCLIGVLLFTSAPDLPAANIWERIMSGIPVVFRGIVCISLLAMCMSTADSALNSGAVSVSHDIIESIGRKKGLLHRYQLQLAKITSICIGLLAMVLTFYYTNLLELLELNLALYVPITVAPFILAVFGFRGTSRTALIGMITGVLTILSWNKWIEPKTGIDGSFVAMLANGLAMIMVHYLCKQPETAGWVQPTPDDPFYQIQQADVRKKAERKTRTKNTFLRIKRKLAKLEPGQAALIRMGFYILFTNLLTYFIASIVDHSYWLIPQLLLGTAFIGYAIFFSGTASAPPRWIVGLCWLIGLAFTLPINLVWHWWNGTNLFLILGLSLAHLKVALLALPLYWGISFVIVTLLAQVSLSSVYSGKSVILAPSSVTFLLLLCFTLALLLFGIFAYLKHKNIHYANQVHYLQGIGKIRESYKLKASLYDSAIAPITSKQTKGNASVLTQVIRKVEESISFLDTNMPLYKQDLQSIINKFYDWVSYFNKREKSKDHALLELTKIDLDTLIGKVEYALLQEISHPPQLFVEYTKDSTQSPSCYMICDINQVVYALVKTVLRVSYHVKSTNKSMVRIQIHKSGLQFKQADPVDNNYPSFMDFEATAWVISEYNCDKAIIPKVKACYYDVIDITGPKSKQDLPPSIDVEMDTIGSIVKAHYGHFEQPNAQEHSTILLVLPTNTREIRSKITVKLPMDALTTDSLVTPKEQADSMMTLMRFHDYAYQASHHQDPIDMKTISGLLLLLREHFGFKRHVSGQLFYVRAVGIAELVVEWAFHSPRVIYAALIYELVRHTRLPLSYVKKHYNLGVYAFVANILKLDQRKELDHPSLLYVQNRLEEAVKKGHVQLSVLFIKLAERLYDLKNSATYLNLEELAHIAQETLAVDVSIAKQYLGEEIAFLLQKQAKNALEKCKISRRNYT